MITLEAVSKWYGPHAAVRDVDLRIEPGQHVGLLGLNGAGKTTTLRMLVGLLRPTTGRVCVEGSDTEDPATRAQIGFLPDQPPLYDEMRVDAYLRFAGRLRGMSKARVAKRLPEITERCALGDVIDAPIGTLSHGYRQRVGIAQAIVHAPKLLVLDEPIQGLDPLQIVEMRDLIRDLRGDHTVVLSTHILGEIAQICDRIVVLHEGRVAAEGTHDELAARFGGDHREVIVRARASAAELQACLEAVPGVREVHVRARNANESEAEVVGSGDLRAPLARAVVDARYDLILLEARQSELEQTLQRLSDEA